MNGRKRLSSVALLDTDMRQIFSRTNTLGSLRSIKVVEVGKGVKVQNPILLVGLGRLGLLRLLGFSSLRGFLVTR